MKNIALLVCIAVAVLSCEASKINLESGLQEINEEHLFGRWIQKYETVTFVTNEFGHTDTISNRELYELRNDLTYSIDNESIFVESGSGTGTFELDLENSTVWFDSNPITINIGTEEEPVLAVVEDDIAWRCEIIKLDSDTLELREHDRKGRSNLVDRVFIRE